MSKRDYKSYGILNDEMSDEQAAEESIADSQKLTQPTVITIPPQLIIKEEERQQEIKEVDQILSEKQDTSFTKYKKERPLQERSKLTKWLLRLMKLTVFIMLLPIISIVAFGVLGIAAIIIGSIAVCMIGGAFILGGICFMASQVNLSLIALGVTASIALFSLGGIIIILTIMLLKWLTALIKKRKRKHQKNDKGGQ